MLAFLPDSTQDIIMLQVDDSVSREDLQHVLERLHAQAANANNFAMLIEARKYTNFELQAAWVDLIDGLTADIIPVRLAIIGPEPARRPAESALRKLMLPMGRFFAPPESKQALAWLKGPGEPAETASQP